MTLLGVEIEDRDTYHEEVWQPESSEDIDCIYVSISERILKEWRERGYEKEYRFSYVLSESLLNAFKHGNKGAVDKSITVRWRWRNDFQFEVIDEGDGFDFRNVTDPVLPENWDRECGRGIVIIKSMASGAAWEDSGRHLKVSCKKHLDLEAETSIKDISQLLSEMKNDGRLHS